VRRDERIAKGFVGVIFIVVGGAVFLQAAAELFEEVDFGPVALLIAGLAFVIWGIVALVRPAKVELGES